MKKVFLTSYYYKPHMGGVENSLYYLSSEYRKAGYDVCIFCSDADLTKKQRLHRHEIQDNGVIIRRFRRFIPSAMIFHAFGPILDLWRAYNYLKKEWKDNDAFYPIAINRHHVTALASSLAGFKNTSYLLPGVVKIQDSIPLMTSGSARLWFVNRYMQSFIIPLNHVIQKLAAKNSRALFVFSNNMKNQVESILTGGGIANIRVVKPGVDFQRFSRYTKLEARACLNIPPGEFVFLCIGRITAHKGFDIAVEAFSKSLVERKKLLIVGDGPLRLHLEKLCRRLGIENEVIFVSTTDQPELYYKASDVFLMTSLHETFGQTILEACASELPVLAFKPGKNVKTATEEIVASGINLFSEFSVDRLSQMMEYAVALGSGKLLEIGKANKHRVMANYSWSQLAKELVQA